jgi:hypothetical protein
MSIKKTGSKNNIANRGTGAKLKVYNGQEVRPVKFISQGKSFIAAQYENKKLVTDPAGEVVPYGSIQ